MKNLKVSMKLIVSFSIIIALLVIIGVFAIINMSDMDRQSDEMFELQTEPLTELGKVIELLQRMRVNLREFALGAALDDQEMITVARQRVDSYFSTMDNNMSAYRETIDATTEGGRRALDLFDEAERLYRTRFLEILQIAYEMARDGEDAAVIQERIGEYTDDINRVVDNFDEAMILKLESAQARNQAISDMAETSLLLIIVILFASIAIAVFLTIYISRLIGKPLGVLSNFMKKAGTTGEIALSPEESRTIGEMSKVKDEIGQTIDNTSRFIDHIIVVAKELETVAGGDLTADIKPLSDKDILSTSLLKMMDNLNNMFGEINSATTQVSTGSKQLSDGAQTLAQGSTEQASAVQQLSASISEIAEKTKSNAGMAKQAAQLANTIMHNAEKGSGQMDEMTAAVKDINQASQSISKVIKVIDDIAFQTNILALNAAVEAARAGQHGKGFAVVAEEVRSLAAKSAEAAKDTGGLIADSMEKAELGARIAADTAASLTEIVSGINESNQIVSEIATSSEEQSAGITQINSGIDQVAQVVQQNSATAEESAAASEEMSGQSDMLEQLIAQFKLKNSATTYRSLPSAGRREQSNFGTSENSDITGTDSGNDFGKY